jgi:hypothetical protein
MALVERSCRDPPVMPIRVRYGRMVARVGDNEVRFV